MTTIRLLGGLDMGKQGWASSSRRRLAVALSLGMAAVVVSPGLASADPTPPPPAELCLTSDGAITERFVGKFVEVSYYSAGHCEYNSTKLSMPQKLYPQGIGVVWGTVHVADNTRDISGELSTGLILDTGYQCATGDHEIISSNPLNLPFAGVGSSCDFT